MEKSMTSEREIYAINISRCRMAFILKTKAKIEKNIVNVLLGPK